MIGKTISHYQIIDKLGEGGMGVVYRARDTHLDRFVAIKTLPPEAVADPGRKDRFVQEAKAASALNHPNIVHVYDIDQADDTHYIAMEYVPGKTLGDLIGRKGLPIGEVVKLGAQIADALGVAHAAGIIHRDLKPANVLVTEKGVVKVLDFGLAKLIETDRGNDSASTQTNAPLTKQGTMVGTVAYMSPEQAEGKRVDARSDIFSLGSVLYEMATGRRAFDGGSGAAILAAILNREPAPIPQAPQEFERIVRRCLRKDPDRRIHSMADVRLALEDLREELESGSLPGPASPAAVSGRKSVFAAAGVAAALLVLAAGIVYWRWNVGIDAIQPPDLKRLTWDAGFATDPALSPDGKLLVYASNRGSQSNLDLWVQQIGGGEPFRLTQDPGNESQPAFSPDGTRVAYHSERDGGGIYVVGTLGGASRRIAAEGTSPMYSPSGDSIAYYTGIDMAATLSNSNNKLFVVGSNGGAPREIRTGFSGVCCPIWTPDGGGLMFLGNQDDKKPLEESLDWWVTPVNGGGVVKTGVLPRTRAKGLRGWMPGEPAALIPGVWSPQGDAVIFSAMSGDSTNLWQIGVNPRSYQSLSEPKRLTWGTSFEWKPAVAPQPGNRLRMAFASQEENVDLWGIPLPPDSRNTAQPRRLTEEASTEHHSNLSPDGKKLAFVSNRSGSYQVWLKNLDTGEQTLLTTSPEEKYWPAFSRDGAFLTYATTGRWEVRRLRLSDGADDVIWDSGAVASSWTVGNEGILVWDVPGRVSLLDLSSRRSAVLLAKENSRLIGTQLSPDGRWIVFTAFTGGRSQTFIAPYRGPSKIDEKDWITISEASPFGVTRGAWRADGGAVYFTSDLDGYRCLWEQPLNALTKRPAGPPVAVFHAHDAQYSMKPTNAETALSASADLLVFAMAERRGSVWMAEWK